MRRGFARSSCHRATRFRDYEPLGQRGVQRIRGKGTTVKISDGNVGILGANGVMGAAATAVFAGAGYHVTMLARDLDQARKALEAAKSAARAEGVGERVTLGTYEGDMARAVASASIIFEALAEDLSLKRRFFEKVDECRRPDALVATNSSGLSITEMAAGLSDSFRRNFMGDSFHYNPPHIIVGFTELISASRDQTRRWLRG